MELEKELNIKITRGTGDYKFLEWIKQGNKLPPKLKSLLLNAMVSNSSEREYGHLLSRIYDFKAKKVVEKPREAVQGN